MVLTALVYSDLRGGCSDWVNEVDRFGFILRGDNIGLGQTTVMLNCDPQRASGNQPRSISIRSRVKQQWTPLVLRTSLWKPATITASSWKSPETFTGKVYDHLDLSQPVVTGGVDETYSEGMAGLFNYYRGGEATDSNIGIADSTFDNYYTSAETPAAIASKPTMVSQENPTLLP